MSPTRHKRNAALEAPSASHEPEASLARFGAQLNGAGWSLYFVFTRKAVIRMKYEAPAIVELSSAIEAVQGSTLKTSFPMDLEGMVTVSAYQSDEA
jgi:hypothetical protein